MELFRSPVFSSEDNTRINMEIEHPELGWVPFTAARDDSEFHSRWLFSQAVKGDVAPYVPPPPPPEPDPEPLAEVQPQLADFSRLLDAMSDEGALSASRKAKILARLKG